MYFLLLCFSFLLHSLNLTNSVEKNYKILFISSAIISSLLHIFGLTISMSILFYRLIINLYNKNYRYFKIDLIFAILIFIVFFIFYLPIILNDANIREFGWVKNQLWIYRVFIEWSSNSLIFIFLSIFLLLFQLRLKIFNLNNYNYFFQSSFYRISLHLISPAVILMIVTLVVSFLIVPIISYRNLIVIYPNLVLFAGALSYLILQNKKFKKIFIIFLIVLTFININFYFKNMIKSAENIEWVIRKTFNKNCNNSLVYFNDGGNKDYLARTLSKITNIYAEFNRPIKSLVDFKKDELNKYLEQNKSCKTYFFSFHTKNFEDYINQLKLKGLNFSIQYAPNVRYKNSSKSGAIAIIN